MICLATFCCQECVFFCIAYYGKLLKYFVYSYICLGVATVLYFIAEMVAISTATTSEQYNGFDYYYDVRDYPPRVHFFLMICGLIIAGAGVARIILFAIMRLRLREKYNIRGAFCDDCLYTWLCTPCATCQMMAEVDHQFELKGERTIFSRGV
ncbi:uncharacterized protein LOC142342413 [Convolutriloba macropyga]|uniref:uncharacterized protein LOC142342413 n=1 Tax=Convolutriloba macropyga TaxID=536237 RepID=UPI003F51FE51